MSPMVTEMSNIPRKTGTIRISVQAVLIWCYFIITIISGLAVFHGDSTLSDGQTRSVLAAILMAATVLAWGAMLLMPNKLSWSLAIFVPVIYFLVTNLNNRDTPDWSIWNLLRLTGFFLLPAICKKELFRYYRKFLIIMAAVGIVAYLANLLSFPLPHRVVEFYGVLEAEYIDYTFSYIYSADGFYRLCGLFNEPGYLGTVMALVLCADRLNFKKKSNRVLLIAGFCTFSMAFIFIIVAYLIAMSIKKPKLFGVVVVLAGFYLFVLPNIKFENEQVSRFISRFIFTDGSLSGDNRSNQYVDQTLMQVLSGENIWWGYGGGYSSGHFKAVSTFKTYIIDYGILGFILMYAPLLLTAFRRARGNLYAIALCICFTMSIYQRPGVFTLLYFLLLFGGIAYIREETAPAEVTA